MDSLAKKRREDRRQALRAAGLQEFRRVWEIHGTTLTSDAALARLPVDTESSGRTQNPDGSIPYRMDFDPLESSPLG